MSLLCWTGRSWCCKWPTAGACGSPGGDLEPGEDPAQAAVRETYEETGLRSAPPELLRTWRYRGTSGEPISCYAYAAALPGDVRLSDEHTAYAWMTVESYVEGYCSAQLAAVAPPSAAQFLAGVRETAPCSARGYTGV